MNSTETHRRSTLYLLVFVGGLAALSWEIIWQLKAALALGISARGTAITLAALMAGMCTGAITAGHWLRNREVARPVRMYGVMELAIGVSGLLLTPAYWLLEDLDTLMWSVSPSLTPFVRLVAIVLVMGPASLAMGATVPLFGLVARQYRSSISLLYGANTFGAAVGVLLMAFVVLPYLGVFASTMLISALNIAIFIATRLLSEGETTRVEHHAEVDTVKADPRLINIVVFVTGWATFALEVAWFRSLRAAFQATTDSFAIILASVLLPLALAARLVPVLRTRGESLGSLMGTAGILILLATPLLERFDHISIGIWGVVQPIWFAASLWVVGLPMLYLGFALPWLLEQQATPRRWGELYMLNTLGAVLGSLSAAWLLLPTIGFAPTAWLAGLVVLALSWPLSVAAPERRKIFASLGVVALLVAVYFESGVGRVRTQGRFGYDDYSVIEHYEGPDSTLSVIEHTSNGQRALIIDGFQATETRETAFYMEWMGHVPMMLATEPDDALVICFGTGMTANAVRREQVERLTLVDVNEKVFEMARHFEVNGKVLEDPRVTPVVMDGRAWLRRTGSTYDVITLEPMPPNFAGVNALYSREFYQLAASHMSDEGVIAQWLPFHLQSIHHSQSIARTFQETFPNSMLWIDPINEAGILVGRKNDKPDIGKIWPGADTVPDRSLPSDEIIGAKTLYRDKLAEYAQAGDIITDDNQLLAYGWSLQKRHLLTREWLATSLEHVDRLLAEQTAIEADQAH